MSRTRWSPAGSSASRSAPSSNAADSAAGQHRAAEHELKTGAAPASGTPSAGSPGRRRARNRRSAAEESFIQTAASRRHRARHLGVSSETRCMSDACARQYEMNMRKTKDSRQMGRSVGRGAVPVSPAGAHAVWEPRRSAQLRAVLEVGAASSSSRSRTYPPLWPAYRRTAGSARPAAADLGYHDRVDTARGHRGRPPRDRARAGARRTRGLRSRLADPLRASPPGDAVRARRRLPPTQPRSRRSAPRPACFAAEAQQRGGPRRSGCRHGAERARPAAPRRRGALASVSAQPRR